jgi:digeranylgeranylglycerophospholipid reductase
MDTLRPDVLVSGLGPAGSRAAAAVAAAGFSTVALERKHSPGRPVQCAEFVPAMLDQELAGLASLTRQPVVRMRTYVETDEADETPDFHGRMIDREAFDGHLAELAQAAGADCRFGETVRSVSADGAIETADGTRYRPRLVIGCDGTRSPIGAAIGATNAHVVETRQTTVALRAASDSTDVFLRSAIVGGYGWLFPKNGSANLGVGVAACARRSLKPALDGLCADLIADGRIEAGVEACTGGAIPVGGRIQSTARLGNCPVLLAGDAAGLANPITGAGIAAAVQSGQLAGLAAAAWLQGDDEALADYDEELGELFDGSLGRARDHRLAMMKAYREGGHLSRAALRRSWIAYPDYWATGER